jgi:glycogen debranching enzyme
MLEDRVILKEDRAFVVSDINGDIPAGNELGLGLYRSDTRFLSEYVLRLNGRAPILLNNSVGRAYVATFQLVNPHLVTPSGPIPRQVLSLRRTRFVHRGLHDRVGIQNCSPDPVEVDVELSFGADFLDIFEVRGYHAMPERGDRLEEATETGFLFTYQGLDDVVRETEVVIHPLPANSNVNGGKVSIPVRLAPQETWVILVDIVPRFAGEQFDPEFEFDRSLEGLARDYHRWNVASTRFEPDNERLSAGLVWRSLEDLRILCDHFPTGSYPTAGTPWYAVPFGRDALISSYQALALNPDLARGTLRYLALHQGRQVDAYRLEEPGKILHEMRYGELANLKLVPHTPYYGSIDATPLFLVLLAELVSWTGDVDLLTELLPNALAALEWIDRFGDIDGDGFVEYANVVHAGLRNQGWKDSGDSLTHLDGALAPLPAALVEVQGYVFHAKHGLARIFRRLGRRAEADRLDEQARELRRRFDSAYWMPELGFYAQALDSDKRQVQAISSNPGHCLWSGVLDKRRAAVVASRLSAPDMFTGWGIRTLSSQMISYNPMSYHNGSVWPHDNSLIADGLRRYGFAEQAELISRAVLEAGMRFSDDRLPELFCGFTRDRKFDSPPGEYLVSCSPQAWGAGALFHLLQTLAGVRVDVLERRVRIDPVETPLYNRLRVEGMRVGEGAIDFTISQGRGGTRVKVDKLPAGLRLELPA